jgi:hypothetical protein
MLIKLPTLLKLFGDRLPAGDAGCLVVKQS